MKILTSFICLLMFAIPLRAQVLVPARAEEAGMSTERLARIDEAINESISKKWFPGVVVLVARNGKIVLHKAYGINDVEKNTPLKKDDLYRIASQTKAITSTAIMMLYEEGKVGLDDPLWKYIPEFRNPVVMTSFDGKDSSYTTRPAKGEITIRHLLTHTSGLDYAAIGSREFKAIYAKAGIPVGIDQPTAKLLPKMIALAKLPLKHDPGDRWTYGLSSDVLGAVVEVASGMSLDDFFHKRIFGPLGMNDTYFYVPKDKQSRLTALYAENDGKLTKITTASGLNPDFPDVEGTYFSGGSGLTSTIEDYAKFLQMFLNGGHYNGHMLLSRTTISTMLTNQTPDMFMQFALGFQVETAKNDSRSPQSIGSFSWGGAFSTSYWADPQEKIVGIIFKQMFPTSHGDIDRKFEILVYQAIAD